MKRTDVGSVFPGGFMAKKKMNVLRLDNAVLLGGCLLSLTVFAEQAAPTDSYDGPVEIRVGTKGKSVPLTAPDVPLRSDVLAPDRRVGIVSEGDGWEPVIQPGKAVAEGRFSMELPNGGVIWLTQDPAITTPVLNVSGESMVAFEQGAIVNPVRFSVYNNYPRFIDRMELVIFAGTDNDLVRPLVSVPVEVAESVQMEWDGVLPENHRFRQGDELQYLVRAWGADGNMDETAPRRLQLVRPEDRERSLEDLRKNVSDSRLSGLSGEELAMKQLIDATYGGANYLRRQTIGLYGSRVRIFGRDMPEGYQLTINGHSVPVDLERQFVVEYLEPLGSHDYQVQLRSAQGREITDTLNTEVTGRYLFLVALADITASSNSVTGSVEALSADDRYDDDFLVEGRLGFYLKGKIQGRYLITAQADTQERRIGNLFDNFFRADPQDLFRQIDPDAYYPVYGDDSVTHRDIDTQGRLYVRLEWDRSQALWGNFQTGLTGTETAQYNRGLYGAALDYRSRSTTSHGESHSHVRVFGSEAQTLPGHSQLLGTGGSVYYFRHTNLLPGSETVVLEHRDPVTGRVVASTPLVRNVDYEVDAIQGRIILFRPLSQVSTHQDTVIRDTPAGGYSNVLLADYEYFPGALQDNLTTGIRAKQWMGDHLALGATWVEEDRGGDDYQVLGADVTLRAGAGTWLRLEQTRTEASSAPVFWSDNGGLSFTQVNNPLVAREGEATAVEGRLNLMENGWTSRDWSLGAWWRHRDDGYSTSRLDLGQEVEETGIETRGELTDRLRVQAQWSETRLGVSSLEQAHGQLAWDATDNSTLALELRHVTEKVPPAANQGMLAGFRYDLRVGPSLDLYTRAQKTLDDDNGNYAENDAASLGARYHFANLSSVGAEYTHGDRGDHTTVSGEYRVTADHTVYANYTHTVDAVSNSAIDPLYNASPIATSNPTGLTLGQRWRLNSKATMFNESQSLKQGADEGLSHTFGMDFFPAEGWSLGFTLQQSELESTSGETERQAYGVRAGHTSASTTWASALEYREDEGAEERVQWVTTHRLLHKLNEDWRIAGRLNYADTEDKRNALADAYFIESNLGFAWRPASSTRIAVLGKYTFLKDLSSLGQGVQAVAHYDQRSHVLSSEGIYRFTPKWEMALKLATREGEVRMERNQGVWLDSRAWFAAVQGRYRVDGAWHGLAEYRWLSVRDTDARQGFLVGIDRDVGEHLRFGVGYNFTDFSDDLTRQDYRYHGFFINLLAKY